MTGKVVTVVATAAIRKTTVWCALLACAVPGQGTDGAETDFRPQKLMAPKAPLKKLSIRSKKEGDKLLRPDELVVGVAIDDESRAYPLNMIKGPDREILNDTLANKKILVTWCSLCFSNLVFDRTVGDDTLDFGVAGMLWNDNMVLYDAKTKSLWSQMLGRAMHGPLTGKRLALLTSTITSWSEWTARYPRTTVVVFHRSATANTVKNYVGSTSLLIGIPEGTGKAWRLAKLRESRVINDVWNGQGVLVTYSEQSGAAQVFARDLGSIRLAFRSSEAELRDMETGTTWDPITGKATAGPLAGARLPYINSVVSFEKTWQLFFPAKAVD